MGVALSVMPSGDRLLVRREERNQKTKGGIYVAHVEESKMVGTVIVEVVAAGPGRITEGGAVSPPAAQPGERVMLDSVHDARWIEDPDHPGKKLYFIESRDVLAVLR